MAKFVDFQSADDPRDVIHEVVQILAEGGLVGLPTETVYALAACSAHAESTSRLRTVLTEVGVGECVLAVKGPYEALDYLAQPGPLVQKLLRRFWPGPVTIAIDADETAGLTDALPQPTRDALRATGVAQFRAPGGDVLGAVSRLLPAPLLLSGETNTRETTWATAEALAADCGDKLDLIVDAGPCKYGMPSSIVRVKSDHWELMREGVVSRRMLERLAGNLYLFVCTGNTCRSPMAESLFRKLLAERLDCREDELVDRGFMVASAGVSASFGSPPASEAVDVLKARGADLRGHESQPVTHQLLSRADRIFTMTRSHREVLLREFPDAAPRVSLLARDGSDVGDPIGAPLDEYRRCAEQIEQHSRDILNEITVN